MAKEIITHLGIKYQRLTKEANPKEGDVLYLMPQPEDGDIPPLKQTVTKWGAMHHGEKENYIIETHQEYHPDFIKMLLDEFEGNKRQKKAYQKEELRPRNTWCVLDRLYKQID